VQPGRSNNILWCDCSPRERYLHVKKAALSKAHRARDALFDEGDEFQAAFEGIDLALRRGGVRTA